MFFTVLSLAIIAITLSPSSRACLTRFSWPAWRRSNVPKIITVFSLEGFDVEEFLSVILVNYGKNDSNKCDYTCKGGERVVEGSSRPVFGENQKAERGKAVNKGGSDKRNEKNFCNDLRKLDFNSV